MTDQKQKEDLVLLQQLFKFIPKEIEIVQTTEYIQSLKNYKAKRSLNAQSNFQLTYDQFEQYLQLKREAKKLLKGKGKKLSNEFNDLFSSLKPKYDIHKRFLEIVGLEAIDIENGTSTPTTWAPKEGIVTVVCFWNTEVDICIDTMKYIHKILNQNVQWKSQVEIVMISLDNESTNLIEQIKGNQWTLVNHYRFTNECDQNNFTISSLGIEVESMVPFAVILNRKSQIEYTGYPTINPLFPNNLDQQIDQLITQEEIPEINPKIEYSSSCLNVV